MKPLPWPSALRTFCLSWVMVCSMSGVAHAQGPAVITDPHQQVEQLMRQDQIEPALAKIQAHLAQRPRDPQMRFWQAVLLTRQGKREQAMQVYTELTQDFPELAEPHNNLGVLQAANNDIDLAQRSFELALRADPQHALAHENLADVLLRQAQRHYQRAAQAPAPIPQRPLTGANPGVSATVSAPRPNLGLAQKQQLLQPLLKLSGPTP
ncbi:Tetratricopeptide repeat [Burkholderiaceae bacterium]